MKLFNARNIEIIVEGDFNQTTKLELAEFTYNTKDGIIRINDNNTSFEIDLSFVYLIDINNELNKLNFYFDNEIKLTIAK